MKKKSSSLENSIRKAGNYANTCFRGSIFLINASQKMSCTGSILNRLDFEQADKCGKTEYLQLYYDYGWEYLFDVNGFSYFRSSFLIDRMGIHPRRVLSSSSP